MGKLFNRLKGIWNYFGRQDKELRDFAIGMSSEVNIKKDLHILFLDYDQATLEEVEESIAELQRFWELSDSFVYKTRNGYHAYFYYDIMPYSRVVMILNFAKYIDDQFRFISRYYDYKTIRVTGKYKEKDISFVKMLKGPRLPTALEAELGDMKRKEREFWTKKSPDLFKKELLKD